MCSRYASAFHIPSNVPSCGLYGQIARFLQGARLRIVEQHNQRHEQLKSMAGTSRCLSEEVADLLQLPDHQLALAWGRILAGLDKPLWLETLLMTQAPGAQNGVLCGLQHAFQVCSYVLTQARIA